MGFQMPDLSNSYSEIRRLCVEIRSPYNDGFTGFHCKQDLYMLKCFIEDQYKDLPTFTGDEELEQKRMIDKLKQR
jgi:hypothetical protein